MTTAPHTPPQSPASSSQQSGTEHAEPPVVFDRKGSVGHIVLNRPRALNALDLAMVDAMVEQMRIWADDDAIALVVIEGAGEKAFCAGGDIRGLYDARKRDDDALLDAFYRREYRLNNYIASYPKPYVALMDGITMGGGAGVSVHGRYRVVSERTLFAMPETGIGFFPDVGGGYFLPRCPGQIGMYLGLSGARIKAADCLYTGLASHGVQSERLPDLMDALAQIDPAGDCFARVGEILARFSGGFDGGQIEKNRAAIDAAFAGASVGAILAALDSADTDFARETAAILRTKSPLALCLAYRQIREGAGLSLDQVLKMEFRLSQRCVVATDLFEGVRAVIVDKDQNPKWQHADISAVDAATLAAYFAPLAAQRELSLDF